MFALVKFYEKDFVNEYGDLKKAYLNSCKWVSSKVMSKNIDKVVWKTIKSSETTITLQLFFILDVNDEKRENCKACKEFHKSFFINEEYNCNSCKLNAFFNRMKSKENVSKGYFKEKIKKE